MDIKDIKILLVDDEPDILEIISYNLKLKGYQVFTASNGEECIEMAKKITPHLILLDVMMPKLDGFETCRQIRSIKSLEHIIIAFLTARSEDYSQMEGFEVGADDYITKPIKPKVLVSKIKSLLRRLKSSKASVIKIGDITIDRDRYIVIKGDERINLPRKEFELLSLLCSHQGKVFKREDILDSVWGNEVIVGDRTIDVHIRKLREKIGEDYFKTVKGVGYKFVL